MYGAPKDDKIDWAALAGICLIALATAGLMLALGGAEVDWPWK